MEYIVQISEKLALSESEERICFIQEGLFATLYLKSLYIALTQTELSHLRVMGRRFKKLDNQLVLRAGLPSEALERRLSGLIKTEWGYELRGKWDLSGYPQWYESQLLLQVQQETEKKSSQERVIKNPQETILAAEAVNKGKIAPSNIIALPYRASADDSAQTGQTITLSAQQCAYLQHWQWGKYPITLDLRFIYDLCLAREMGGHFQDSGLSGQVSEIEGVV